MGRLIEKHAVTIQLTTIVVVVISLIGITRGFTKQEDVIISRLKTLETGYSTMRNDIESGKRKGYRTEVELAKINTKLEGISALLTEIRDDWHKRLKAGG